MDVETNYIWQSVSFKPVVALINQGIGTSVPENWRRRVRGWRGGEHMMFRIKVG